MDRFDVHVHASQARLPRERQLAWHIAQFAANVPTPDADVAALVAARVIDSLAVALPTLGRHPVRTARAMALAHPRPGGALLLGLSETVTVHAEWAAWANGTAVRELDFNDTFLAADYSHPADCIAPLLAVAQQTGQGGKALTRAIATAYEVQVALVKAISLHAQKKDHVAHLAPAMVAGLGALLGLKAPVVYQAVNLAVHLAFSTRQSRKGEISSWKASVPGFAGKLAIESLDRAMRGEAAPSPIYEGEDSVIAWMLAGPDARYAVALPSPGEAPRGIMETYAKAHSAEYHSQAMIDLAFELRPGLPLERIAEVVIHTSDHSHKVIGTGANDPQKLDPEASRETLDHSLMYIVAVALEDGEWHHETSYAPARARRPSTVALWHKVRTLGDAGWNARYHAADPAMRAFGGRMEIRLDDGRVVAGELAVAHAHPNGKRPWGLADHVAKFNALSPLAEPECQRVLGLARRLADLDAAGLRALNPILPPAAALPAKADGTGIFDYGLA
ncbi:MAG: MmgE/PrpD family protein [Alphaproteobacteria bacterium]|nr:MmgE/PrpD family protein [Alphaproteobacteria bacterium]